MRTLIVLLSFHLYGATPSIPDAQSLLERSDAVRNGGYSFTVRVNIRNFEDGKVDEEHTYQVFQKGLDKSYVEYARSKLGPFVLENKESKLEGCR